MSRTISIQVCRYFVCRRTYYARSPYQRLSSSASFVLRQTDGAYWLMALCGVSGDRGVSVAVPVVDTQFHVDPDGNLVDILGTASTRFMTYRELVLG